MEDLIKLLIEKLKHESVFIIFCITLVGVLWYSNQRTTDELIKINVSTTKTIEQNNAILTTISKMLQTNRETDMLYWRERHDRIESSLKRLEIKVESLK